MTSFLRSFFLFFAEHGIKTIVGLATTLFIINHLLPRDYGVLALGLSIFGVLSALSSLGLDGILLKKVIEKIDFKLIEVSILLRLLISVSTVSIVACAAFFVELIWLPILLILCTSLIFESFQGLREYEFGQKNYGKIIIANSFGNLTQLLLVIVLIQFNMSLYWFALPFVSNRLVSISFLIFFQREKLLKAQLKDRNDDLSLFFEGLPLLATILIGLVYLVQDQWMISIYMTIEDVGIYAAGTKLIFFVMAVPTIITNILYHKIIEYKLKEDYTYYLQGIYSALFYGAGLLCFGLFLFSEQLIKTIYPDVYAGAVDVMEVYILVLLFSFFQSLNNKLLILYNLQKVIMLRTGVALILNFLFNIFLIPKYGLIGAAYSTVASEVFILISYAASASTRHLFWYEVGALNPKHILQLRRF